MVCILAPSVDELFVTAAEVRTTQRWLVSIFVHESPHINSGIGRPDSRGRYGLNDKITSEATGARYLLRYTSKKGGRKRICDGPVFVRRYS